MFGSGVHGRDDAAHHEIREKHGTALIRTLRAIYGPGFAPGVPDSTRLIECLDQLDPQSLRRLYRDHAHGALGSKISAQYL